jgi:methylmalonyl-CoA mutase
LTDESPLRLAGEFPPSTRDEWRAGVNKVLAKGKTDLTPEDLDKRFERELVAHLYEGIDIAPLYTSSDVSWASIEGFPGLPPYGRGGTLLGGSQGGWDIRQVVDLTASEEGAAAALALDQLERGASSLLLRRAHGSPDIHFDVDMLETVLDGVHLDLITVSLDESLGPEAPSALLGLWERKGIKAGEAQGVLGQDPLGSYASDGGQVDLTASLAAAVATAQECVGRYPKARAVVVDVTRYHEAGCSDTEELGCAIATGIAYLRLFVEAGLDIESALSQIEFRFAATSDQFLTIAKLRAARLLWWRVAQASGAQVGAQQQHVMTSRAMLSRYDPWVNLLRGTIACFAAGVAGADAVTVEPYDLLVDPLHLSDLGRRMARNTQLVLIEESHAAKVIDPAGGSWYVESLTRSVAEKAWSWMQTIEEGGGIQAALDSGLVSERIDQTWEKRLTNIGRRVDTITGVSDFPNAEEEIPPPRSAEERPPGGLPRRRYAAPYEDIRQRVDAYAKEHATRPAVLLVNVGSPSDYTARTTYAKSFFESAGLATVALEVGDDVAAQVAGFVTDGVRLACLCSSDAVYAATGAEVAAQLAGAGFGRLYAAGRRSEELEGAGVEEFVGVGCNVLDALEGALSILGVN